MKKRKKKGPLLDTAPQCNKELQCEAQESRENEILAADPHIERKKREPIQMGTSRSRPAKIFWEIKLNQMIFWLAGVQNTERRNIERQNN